MAIRYLITSLANFGATVSNIQNSYDLNTIPDKISRAMLPCLIPIPEVGSETGLTTLSYTGNSPQVTLEITHLLLNAEAADSGVRRDLPNLITMLDNYLTAAKAQKSLDTQSGPPSNQVIMAFGVQIGLTTWGDVQYHSLSFKHKYTLYG